MKKIVDLITNFFAPIPHHTNWLRLLVVVNVFGSLYGFNWYAKQLAATPWYLWPVVPDSPLSSLAFGIYLAFRLAGRRTPALAAFAQQATFKYGLWSVIVLGGYVIRTGDANPELLLLMFTHAGMAIEAYLLMVADPVPRGWLLTVFGWLVINDTFDYGLGTHPAVPDPAALPVIAAEACALTWTALAVALAGRRRNFLSTTAADKVY